jgi:hypothetical protein
METYLPYTKAINSEQLGEELGGVSVVLVGGKLRFVGDITEKQAKDALETHIPIPIPELTISEKLASVGLSVDDLKTALGLS